MPFHGPKLTAKVPPVCSQCHMQTVDLYPEASAEQGPLCDRGRYKCKEWDLPRINQSKVVFGLGEGFEEWLGTKRVHVRTILSRSLESRGLAKFIMFHSLTLY